MNLKKPDQLIQELKGMKFIPYFDLKQDQLFNEIKEDSQELINKIRNLLKFDLLSLCFYVTREQEEAVLNSENDEKKYQVSLMAMMSLVQRNKRAALIYLYFFSSCFKLNFCRNHRLNKICESFWLHGGQIPQDQKEYMSKEEKEFLSEYKKIIQDYGNEEKIVDLDLTKNLDPPKDLHIEVRVIEDCGEFKTSDGGVLKLDKNSTHYLKISDIEHLLKQGYLVPTDI